MRTVLVAQQFPGSVDQAQARWYDTSRWPAWVDGLSRVIRVDGEWPQVGASVTWESAPAGRGRVIERVVGYEHLVGQTVEVDDDSITGRQSVHFRPAQDGVEVDLSLEYALKRRSILTPVIDALFIRRAMASSLRMTLVRFGGQLGH